MPEGLPQMFREADGTPAQVEVGGMFLNGDILFWPVIGVLTLGTTLWLAGGARRAVGSAVSSVGSAVGGRRQNE